VALTSSQKKLLKKHSSHHTKKHMAVMNALMNKGKTFKEAHSIAMREVGK
jgi:hypothetical protein